MSDPVPMESLTVAESATLLRDARKMVQRVAESAYLNGTLVIVGSCAAAISILTDLIKTAEGVMRPEQR